MSTPAPDDSVRIARLREDASRAMSVNLTEGIALSHKLLSFTSRSEVVTVPAFDELLRRLVEADARFVLIGGLAVNAWGVVRGTKDVDIVPDPDLENLKRIAEVAVGAEALMASGERVQINTASARSTSFRAFRAFPTTLTCAARQLTSRCWASSSRSARLLTCAR